MYSTFVQRTYDQLSQDLCIDRNPAVIGVFMGTIAGLNDATHLGFFDIPLLGNIPNLVYLAPTCAEEYLAMLDWALRQREHPVALRVPGAAVAHSDRTFDTDYGRLDRFETTRRGSRVSLVGLGAFHSLAEAAADRLEAEAGIGATVINPRYITGLDEELLEALKADHEVVATLEDGAVEGGFGEKIARWYGPSAMRVLCYGARKEFADRFDPQELLRANRLTAPQIAEDIRRILAEV